MTDVTQGADALDDTALFEGATSTDTLEKFENPEPPKVEPPAKVDPPAPEVPVKEEAAVPSGRFREETEARRRAERERDELRARLDVLSRPPPKKEETAADIFENPKGFVQQELKPYLEQMQADFRQQREAMSLEWATRSHGAEKVDGARQALEQGMARNDPNAWATYNRAMASHDPYGVIVGWHRDGETLRSIGGDLEAYRARVIEEAMKDPDVQKRVFEAAKGQALATNNSVARPVKPSVASSPSLGNIGAGGTDTQVVEPSDEQLFRAATTAKRR